MLTELNESEDKKDPKSVPTYLSKDGFEKVPVLRGMTEIEPIFTMVMHLEGVICGGYVRYMCSPALSVHKAGDVDIYFPEEREYLEFKEWMESEHKMKPKHENAISLTYSRMTSDAGHPLFRCPVLQIIKPTEEGAIVAKGSIEKIISNFDFTVVRAGLLSKITALVDADFMHDERLKILRLKNIHCPISSTLRCMKYARKGYWLPPMQALSLFLDWENRDDEYRSRLKEFLMMANAGEGFTKKEIDELEAMMRVD